ncbi:MAG: hypothetical protein KatS3mg014_2665 [Actinomycetota bacterium]|nr:MAG: hypothetical protein KatS3mg014_2665 [Actinomycetota bacterium]
MRSVATCFRFSAIVLSVPLLLGVMPQQDLVAALRWFRFPYVLCFTMALALRMIPQLERDLGTIRDAQRSRGIELDRGQHPHPGPAPRDGRPAAHDRLDRPARDARAGDREPGCAGRSPAHVLPSSRGRALSTSS